MDEAKVPESPTLKETVTDYAAQLVPTFTTEFVQLTLDFMADTGQIGANSGVKPTDVVTPELIDDERAG